MPPCCHLAKKLYKMHVINSLTIQSVHWIEHIISVAGNAPDFKHINEFSQDLSKILIFSGSFPEK